ncbi:MAG: septum formation initiator family protein [Acidobacteriota bacterium]
MRFERIVGGQGPPRVTSGKKLPAGSRREEARPLPELMPDTPAPASGARPDGRHVRPASYVVVSLGFSFLVFGFFLLSPSGLLKVRKQRIQLAAMQAEVEKLYAENLHLEEEVIALKTDPKAVEKIARETLNLVKPGEVVLLLPDGWQTRVKPPAAPDAPAPTAAPTPR